MVSPPYSEALSNNAGGRQKRTLTNSDQLSIEKGLAAPYSENPLNIGNLSHGSIDAIVTSPPFSEAKNWADKSFKLHGRDKGGISRHGIRYGSQKPRKIADKEYFGIETESPENIDKLPHGSVDAIITSPPFADTNDRKDRKMDQTRGIKGRASDLPTSPDNIGNLPIDAVITSPPYEDAIRDSEEAPEVKRERIKKAVEDGKQFTDRTLSWIEHGKQADSYNTHLAKGYGHNKEQIGRFSGETYLEAMLKVYAEMFQVLKPSGLAMIAIRPFIRNKQVIDLPFQTWLLMQKVGFTLAKLYKLRLENQSFWRILYSKKHPEVPLIGHEYVLVCQKVIMA